MTQWAHDDTDKDAERDTLRMELMDTLAVNWPIASWPERRARQRRARHPCDGFGERMIFRMGRHASDGRLFEGFRFDDC